MDEDVWSLFKTLKVSEDAEHFENDADIPSCDFCHSSSIELEEGNFVCKSCNSIVHRFIDANAEWRYYGADDNKSSDPSRCGLPTNELFPDSSLGSMISNKMNESYDMRKIRKYHMWNSMTYKDRSLFQIFENIATNASNHGIASSIIEEAKAFYKKVSESKITRGENKHGLIASSIYVACKTNNVPRSTKEIAKIFNIKSTTMTKGCKKFQDVMKMNLDSTCPEDFIQRFSSRLNLNQDIRQLCNHVVKKADEHHIANEGTPPSIAAGSIYLCIVICKLPISKKELSTTCGISPVTITKCYKKLYEQRGLLFPKDAILKYHIK